MSSLPKNINIGLNKNSPQNKFLNRPKAKLGRIKSKGEKKNIPMDTHSIYTKNAMLNSILDKNMLMKKASNRIKNKNLENINSFSLKEKQKITLKKKNLNFNKLNNMINKGKWIEIPKTYSPMDFLNKAKLKTMSAKIRDVNIQKNNFISENKMKIKKNFFENIKIKNIISLWNELEVLTSYRKYFCFIFKELDEEEQDNLYEHEIKELIDLKNNIKNLTYNIELRIGIIKKLSELNTELNKEIKNNSNELNNFIKSEMMKEIEKLTEQTINIVLYMKKVKEEINSVTNLGKYSLDIICKKFHFDKNYIIKMKTETSFLREGYAKVFFNIKNEESPFFLKVCDKNKINKNEPFTQAISLDENQINDIKECNYYIYKELIAYQNEKANKKIFRCISPLRKNSSAYNYANVNFYSNNLFVIKDEKKENEKEEIVINGSGIEINKDNHENNNIEIKRNSKNNINNTVKLMNTGNNFYSLDTNKRNNKKMYTYNHINNMNNINIIKKNRNSDILDFQNNLDKNKKYNPFLNNSKSEMQNNPVFEVSKKEDDLPSFSPTNESKKDEDLKLDEDIKEE